MEVKLALMRFTRGCRVLVWAWLVLAAPAWAADGARIYRQYCSVCHGDKGNGDSRARGSMRPPPRDFTAPKAAVELDRARMLTSVREGRPGTAMSPWKTQLSEEEVAAVVDYIRQRFMVPVAMPGAGQGRRLYAENCSVCHGDHGRGAVWASTNMEPPPRDFTSERAQAELTRERMLRSVTYGRPDTAMPGFGTQLSPGQIGAIVDYVRQAFVTGPPARVTREAGPRGRGKPGVLATAAAGMHGQAREVAPAADMSLPMPGRLRGDPERGKASYLQNCVACHGVDGNGRGPRAYFILRKPRDFTHPGARHTFNRPALFRAISSGRRGTVMPAWDKVLDEQAIADVAEYVFRRFIRGGEE